MPFVFRDVSHGIRSIWGSSRARLCSSCPRNQSYQHQQLMRVCLHHKGSSGVCLPSSLSVITKALCDGQHCAGFTDWASGQFHRGSRFVQWVNSWAEISRGFPWFQGIQRPKPSSFTAPRWHVCVYILYRNLFYFIYLGGWENQSVKRLP